MNGTTRPLGRGRVADCRPDRGGRSSWAVPASAAPRAAADSPETAVLDWNKHALDALVNAGNATTPGAGNTPPVDLAAHRRWCTARCTTRVNAHRRRPSAIPRRPSAAHQGPRPGSRGREQPPTACVMGIAGGQLGLLDSRSRSLRLATCAPTAYTAAVHDACREPASTPDWPLRSLKRRTRTALPLWQRGVAAGEAAAAEMLDVRSGRRQISCSACAIPVSEPEAGQMAADLRS